MNDSAEAVLELQHVGLCYRRRRGFSLRPFENWALLDVSLQLRKGETLGVIGRNGSGKTTLLKVMAGIFRPDRGSIVESGYQTTLLSLQAGFVPYLSARTNVVLNGLLLGLGLKEIGDKMQDILSFAELEEFADEPIQTFSSGMRARLGFSTAFHIEPDILLIDEVLGVGDAAFIRKSRTVMEEKIRSHKTVVLVSHAAESIRALCDRVIWMERGKIAMEGGVDEVLDSYLTGTSARRQPPA